MGTPLVSILVPCYNVETYLYDCLKSIIAQSYTNIQIVLLDDGSKDKTWSVMSEFSLSDERIEIYQHQNMGVARTRNELLSKVKGDYVLFVDSDDRLEYDMIEFMINGILKYDADVIICDMVINDTPVNNEYSTEICSKDEIIKKFLIHKELKGSLWNKLLKTEHLDGLFFDNRISYGEDALFCWSYFQRVSKVVYTNRQLYHYRMNESSISHQSFGEKKLSGHEVWRIIVEQTENLYPKFVEIAKGRWAMEGTYLLMQANQSRFKKNDGIRKVQRCVQDNIDYSAKYTLGQKKHILLGKILSRWYSFGKIYFFLQSLK